MAGMFSRLYAYRERAETRPLENYLIEALAEVFRRLPDGLKASLASVLVPAQDKASFATALTRHKVLRLDTQVAMTAGDLCKRPDLVLYAGGRPLMVVEAKVGAVLQHHGPGDQVGEDADVHHQLRTYGDWIAAENRSDPGWPGAIAFLTAHTAPPSDFDEGRYRGAVSAIRSWKDVADWIAAEVDIADRDSTHCALAAEFRLFLEERKLMTKYMSSRDIASMSVYAQSAGRVEDTFYDVIDAVGRHAKKLKGGRQIKADYWSSANIYWAWFHFARSVKRDRSKPYVAFGICFEVTEPWTSDAAKLPANEPFFFLSCGDEWGTESPSVFLTGIPAGWTEIEDDRVIAVARPVSQIAADPELRVEELKAWAIGHVDRLVACIPGYADAAIEAPAANADEKAEA